MKNNSFYLSAAGALLLSLASASILSTEIAYAGIISAISGLSAFLLIYYASKNSMKRGRTARMKATLVSASGLYELVLMLGAASTPVIMKNPGIGFIALAGIAFAELLDLEYTQQLKSTISQDLGRNARVLVLVASMAAYSFQQYYMFYGMALIFLVSAYDSLRLIHQIREEI